MNPGSTHLDRWIQIWIEKYATGSELKSSGGGGGGGGGGGLIRSGDSTPPQMSLKE